MTTYEYTAVTASGENIEGRLQAESEEDLRWTLMERGLQPSRMSQAAPAPKSIYLSPGQWLSARSVHIELSLRQISVMLRSGLTLLASVETIIEQPPSRAVKQVYEQVRQKLENGSSFAEALSDHKCFPVSVVSMVSMGEESGNLDTVVERGSLTMETRRRNRAASLTALFYPAFTFLFALGICVYMILAVIPPMRRALEALGRPLPPITQSLMDIADFFSTWGVTVGVSLLISIIVLVLLWLWPPGRLAIDRFLLRLPLIGTIFRTSATALFARSMGTLLSSGIAIVEGLRIMASLHNNHYLSAVVESARRRILEGGTLAESLSKPHAYSPMMIKMVSVGEASGNLEETLEHVADFHEDRLQTLIKQLSTMIEPAIILLVGALVGYVYGAFFMALYGAM
ncbi:MAG: type II secretion system F family protein [Verrucomicrobiota bacterium]